MIKSPETAKTHASRLRRMCALAGVKQAKSLFGASRRLLAAMRGSDLSPCSQLNLLKTLLSTWPAAVNKTLRARVSAYKNTLSTRVSERVGSGQKRGRMRKTRITFSRIKKTFSEELARWSRLDTSPGLVKMRRFLTLSIYATMTPKRADFGDALVTRRASKDRAANYINMKKNQVVLVSYKNNTKYGELREALDPRMKEAIEITLRMHPRRFLFPGSKGVDVGIRPKSYGDLVESTMRAYFGEPMRVNDLRHLYISEFCVDARCYNERRELAKSMLHSIDMQVQYEQFK